MKYLPKDPSTWIPKDIFLAYSSDNSEAKMSKFYDKASQKENGFFFELNWLAILILPAWLGYRKQWAMLLTISIIIGATSFLEYLFNFTLPSSSFTGVNIALGCMGTSLYFQDANIKYQKLKLTMNSPEEILREMKGKGSASVPMAFVGLILSLSIIVGLAFLADFIFTGSIQL